MNEKYSPPNLIIRNYQHPDLDACRNLWVELTEWHRQIYQSPNIGGDQPGLYFDDHLARVGAEHIWVAELAGQVVGMAGLIPGDSEAELEPVIVSQAQRGVGIGQRLVEVVIDAARASGARQLKVLPVARNSAAIQFFHEMGFDVLGHIELFQDLDPDKKGQWADGERLAGRSFRV